MSDHKRFYLQRDEDVSGISGPGRVADGVLWTNGTVSVCWRGKYPSVVYWHTIEWLREVNCHKGKTRLVWLDQPEPSQEWYDE